MRPPAAAWLLIAISAACGGGPAPGIEAPIPVPRRTVVWLDGGGLTADEAAVLAETGVDEVAVRRGSVALTTGVPVVRLGSLPEISGALPVGVVLRLAGGEGEADEAMAASTWRAIRAELGVVAPAELILEVPAATGLERFVRGLQQESGVPVVPLLTVGQLADPAARSVAAAAGSVIVPVYGAVGRIRDGLEASTLPLDEQLADLAATGVKVRVGVVLAPRSQPPLEGWGDDLDGLCEGGVAEISTSSSLDRTFVIDRAVEWSGRRWQQGDRIAVQWMDCARLDQALREASHLMLPELGGWDLMLLPPPGPALGIDRESLLAYLKGRGPAPEVSVRVERRGRQVEVALDNPSLFASAVSTYGTWVEVAATTGSLLVEERGDFDRVELGTRRGGEWKRMDAGTVDAVRFGELYLARGEEVGGALVRLPSPRSGVSVRWQVLLSTGETVSGVAE
jgi:hypothetical protein